MNNVEIRIPGSAVDSGVINECIKQFKEIKASGLPSQLKIVAENEIKEFDFSLIGHFILFKVECPQLSIIIHLHKNRVNNSRDSIVDLLKYQVVHSRDIVGENQDIFILKIGPGDGKKESGVFELSPKVLPMVYLDEGNYSKLFKNRMNFVSLSKLELTKKENNKSIINDEKLYQACKEKLAKQIKRGDYLQILSQLAFYRALAKAKMLVYYLYNELDEDIENILKQDKNKENLQDFQKRQVYLESLVPVFNEIKEESPINILLFFSLISSELIFPTRKRDETEILDESKKISNLWEFTKNVISGINELAKNIIEHSDKHKGIISGFINEKQELKFCIFDHGETGIMETFLNFLSDKRKGFEDALKSEELKDMVNYKKKIKDELYNVRVDIETISDGYFEFVNFFEYSKEKILNEQKSRSTVHIGIFFYSQLVTDNGGIFEVISNSSYENNTYPKQSRELPKIGTFYKTTLPLKEMVDLPAKPKPEPIPIKEHKSANLILDVDFFDFEFVKNENPSKDKKCIFGIELSTTTLINRHLENKLWEYVSKKIYSLPSEQKEIICVDFEKVEGLNESYLLRFLRSFVSEFPETQLIIFNIQMVMISELRKKNDFYFDRIGNYFADNRRFDKATLIYSYVEIEDNDENKKRFYFTDILWGKEEEEFYGINKIISDNHHTSIIGRNTDKNVNYSKIREQVKRELPKLFDQYGDLKHFNLLIKDSNSKTLFNHHAETLLQNEISPKNERLKFYLLKDKQAYRISGSHFRLGSKIHIKDFYYAKSFFQNSFYAYRYALMLAYDIINKPELKNIIEKRPSEINLSIIGYGLYSELLINYVKKFIYEYYKQNIIININTNTVTDTEECKLNKPVTYANPIYSNVIIIVPIATTFTTSIKIGSMLKEEYKKQLEKYENDIEEHKKQHYVDQEKINKIKAHVKRIKNFQEDSNKELNLLEPYYNVFSVVDVNFTKMNGHIIELDKGSTKIDGTDTGNNEGEIFYDFGWRKIDKRESIVETEAHGYLNRNNRFVKQKYYIYQTTQWHKIAECKICFPSEERCANKDNCLNCPFTEPCVINEKPLFVTDKTSLTPELILEQPVARTIKEIDRKRKLSLTDTTIGWGHIERDSNHYRYYFNNDELWDKNKEGIKKWLEEWLKANPSSIDNNKRVIILAPCHFSNADFVEMVNQIIFSNRAIIIHYDPNIDNVQNFEIFYSKAIGIDGNELNNTKIYFVDDVLTSGSTLFVVNSFLQHIESKLKRKLEFADCFFFINRTGYYEYNDIKKVLDNNDNKIHSFANLHFPYIKSAKTPCPLCDEYEKLQKLYDNSYLTRIKIHFRKEQRKIIKKDIHNLKYESDDNKYERRKNERIRRQVEAIHRMYDLFSEDRTDDYKNDLEKILKNGSYNGYKKLVKFLIDKTNNPFDNDYLKEGNKPPDEKGNLLTETEITVLKCLTRSPFCDYMDIRISAFRWVISLLERKVKQLNDILNCPNENDRCISLNSLGELKMLIRRATLLKSNYIVSYRLLHLIRKIYNNEAEIVDNENNNTEKAKYALHRFSIFFVAQMNEMLYRDEACSEKLNKRFEYFKSKNHDDKTLFKQLIHMLLVENAAKIRVFAENHEKFFFEKDLKGKIEGLLVPEINEIDVETHYEQLQQIYNLPYKPERMIKFLWLRLKIKAAKISEESKQEHDDVRERIKELSEFINISNNGGYFAIVKYKKTDEKPYYLLLNEGKGKTDIAQKGDDYLRDESFLIEFIRYGKNLSNNTLSHSILELHKDDKGNWTDLFSNETADVLKDFPIPPDSKRLLLLRIDRDKGEIKEECKGQAVIGFYSNINDPIDIEKLHYLLLLRGNLSNYLAKLVEGNDSFRDWVEDQEKINELNTSDHDLNTMMSKLGILYPKTDTPETRHFDYLHSILVKRENLHRICVNGSMDAEPNRYIETFSIKKEIDYAYNIIFEESLNIVDYTINTDELTKTDVCFPLFIFRAILYEYIKNVRNQVIRNHGYKIKFDIVLKSINNGVNIVMENSTKSGYEDLLKYEDELKNFGYKEKRNKKGLYKNSRLLKATGCKNATIIITKPDFNNIFNFKLNFWIKNYESN